MDAWETLTQNSTAETGDAWEHLQSQSAGGPGQPSYLVLVDGVDVSIQPTREVEVQYVDQVFIDVSTKVEDIAIDISIDKKDFIVNVEKTEFEVEI